MVKKDWLTNPPAQEIADKFKDNLNK